MDTFWRDVRLGGRWLWKRPVFTLVATATIALGIGVNAAIFTVVNAVVLRPLPYSKPDRLVHIWETNLKQGSAQNPVSLPNFYDWRDQNQSFESIAAYRPAGGNLGGPGEPERVQLAMVSASLFPMLGVEPALGRNFLMEEDTPAADFVAIVSHSLWERRCKSSANIPGETIEIGGSPFTVVGVLPASFRFPEGVELWVPIGRFSQRFMRRLERPNIGVVARLRPSVTLKQAQAEMDAISHRLEQTYPESNTDYGVAVLPLHEQITGKIQPSLKILIWAVVLVLLISCVNVAGMLLARSTGRETEMAIRAALGASRTRIVRQLFAEGLLLAVMGAIPGLLLGGWGVKLLIATLPSGVLPRAEAIAVDVRVIGATLLVSIITGLIFGFAPALHLAKANVSDPLKEGSHRAGGSALRRQVFSTLVASEIALAIALMICAGVAIRSFLRLQQTDAGFNTNNLLTMRINPTGIKYATFGRIIDFNQELLNRIEALPGVAAAASVNELQFGGGVSTLLFSVEGRGVGELGEASPAVFKIVSPHYFTAMGIPLLKGRSFTNQDRETSPRVIMINQAMAKRYWPDEDPIDKRIALQGFDGRLTIVGVSGNVKQSALNHDIRPEIYFPFRQYPTQSNSIVVRTTLEPLSMSDAVRGEVRALDADLPVYDLKTMERVASESTSPQRFITLAMMVFAFAALVLAIVGVYGVTAYIAGERTREVGLRMALGAERGNIIRLIVRRAIGPVGAGAAAGLLASFLMVKLLSNAVEVAKPFDPVAITGVLLLLSLTSLLASYIPARRAAAVDPMQALRYD